MAISQYIKIPVQDIIVIKVSSTTTLFQYMRRLLLGTENSQITYTLPSSSVFTTLSELQEMVTSGYLTSFLTSNGYAVTANSIPTIVSVDSGEEINSQNNNEQSKNIVIPSPWFPNSVPILAGGGGGFLMFIMLIIYYCLNRRRRNGIKILAKTITNGTKGIGVYNNNPYGNHWEDQDDNSLHFASGMESLEATSISSSRSKQSIFPTPRNRAPVKKSIFNIWNQTKSTVSSRMTNVNKYVRNEQYNKQRERMNPYPNSNLEGSHSHHQPHPRDSGYHISWRQAPRQQQYVKEQIQVLNRKASAPSLPDASYYQPAGYYLPQTPPMTTRSYYRDGPSPGPTQRKGYN